MTGRRSFLEKHEFLEGFRKFAKIFPREKNEEVADAYFDRFKWLEGSQWVTIANKVVDKAKRFPVPSDIWEVINEMGFREKSEKIGDPFVHIDCECGNSFAVSRKKITENPDHFTADCAGKFYGVCNRSYDVSYLKELL